MSIDNTHKDYLFNRNYSISIHKTQIATSKASSWTLKSEVYKEVRIWNWSFEDREIKEVINNAKKAYEKLNYPPDAKERANLNPPTASTKFNSGMPTQTKKLKPEPESRNVKRPKADLASTDSSTDTKSKVAAKKVKKASTVTPPPKRVSAAVAVTTDGARKVNNSTTTTRLKPTPSANGKPPPPSASSSSSSGLTNGGGTVVNGTTPKRALPTIDIDDLLSTANGSNAKETNHVNNGTKRKERGEDGGGGGGEVVKTGYKIRKRGAAVAGAAGTVRGAGMGAEKEDLGKDSNLFYILRIRCYLPIPVFLFASMLIYQLLLQTLSTSQNLIYPRGLRPRPNTTASTYISRTSTMSTVEPTLH